MDDNIPTVRLSGIKHPAALEEYFASTMVDTAYVHRIEGDKVDLLLDSTDVRVPDEREWMTAILKLSLEECGEDQAQIQFLVELQS